MWLPYDNDQPLSSGERWTVAALILFFLAMFAAEVATNYEPVKLTALFFVLCWGPLLVLHEAGHALVAAWLGWRVVRVSLGMGPVLKTFQLGQTTVDVRLYPLEGFVQSAPKELRNPRIESALVYFGGPGIELVLLGVFLLLLGPTTLLVRSENLAVMLVQGATLVILVGTFVNLVPHYANMGGLGLVANDGMGIVRSFTQPDEWFASQVGETFERKEENRQDQYEDEWEG